MPTVGNICPWNVCLMPPPFLQSPALHTTFCTRRKRLPLCSGWCDVGQDLYKGNPLKNKSDLGTILQKTQWIQRRPCHESLQLKKCHIGWDGKEPPDVPSPGAIAHTAETTSFLAMVWSLYFTSRPSKEAGISELVSSAAAARAACHRLWLFG